MPPDATDTKRRLMKAAIDEFARYGLAGARVDRIAENAAANKRSIYMHFGTKEELFDLVHAQVFLEVAASITFGEEHLIGYAGDLFDRLEKWPHVRRLYLWAGLEREQAYEPEVAGYRDRLVAITRAQQEGRIRSDIPAAELMAMVIGIVISWESAAWSLKALQPEFGFDDVASRRAAVVSAVAGFVRPPAPDA
ncbi:putative TetR family regulatory protein [Virgisporangium aliadipatigenens]|uniref:Putative TetR family regulatory protein n=1 Tax=Virgisporangium aliadipatigenens TaxID=741659 RepID=A0A8J4DSI8_9ACTN|nr:TetR family transcriptional regulator [Virgisporangium aliadipatigenens]GIJ47923.1 putative TetR family regulatory protein [Virgisporangium aliadipatigenens]